MDRKVERMHLFLQALSHTTDESIYFVQSYSVNYLILFLVSVNLLMLIGHPNYF